MALCVSLACCTHSVQFRAPPHAAYSTAFTRLPAAFSALLLALWVTLFLGFHTLGLYVHNYVMQAFGGPWRPKLLPATGAHQAAKPNHQL